MSNPDDKVNYCDKDGNCTITALEPETACRFFGDASGISIFCDYQGFENCYCLEARKDAQKTAVQRDGAMVAHQAHNLNVAGSSPAPATNIKGIAAGGSGASLESGIPAALPIIKV